MAPIKPSVEGVLDQAGIMSPIPSHSPQHFPLDVSVCDVRNNTEAERPTDQESERCRETE